MDDKFIKEKLDLVTKNDDKIEGSVPDSLRAINMQYAQKFADMQKDKPKNRRRYLIPVFSSCAAAILICVALLSFAFFCKHEEDTRYNAERNYVEEVATYEQIVAENNLLFYDNKYSVTKSFILKTESTKQSVLASALLHLSDSELSIEVLLDKDYEYADINMYQNLKEKASTDLFEYSYKVFSEDKTALATCEYNNRTYYFRYLSLYPEDITLIMNSMHA